MSRVGRHTADSGSYAVVIGEALIDLIEERDQASFRALPGGSPLNVAVGVSRLGSSVEFLGSFGRDGFGNRLREFLASNGVSIGGSIESEVPTSLAMTSFQGAEPSYTFYGTPPSYGFLQTTDLDRSLLQGASVVHAGSISLMEPSVYEAVLTAFGISGPLRTLDPNVRPTMIEDLEAFRGAMETLFRTVDVVKLSNLDAQALYSDSPHRVAERIADFGPKAVIVTLGSEGIVSLVDGTPVRVPGRLVEATDTTGAGDACMAAIIAELVTKGWPADEHAWEEVLSFAVDVSAYTCCAPGGATAIPTREEVAERFTSSPPTPGRSI